MVPGKYHIPNEEQEGDILPNKLGLTNIEELGKAEAEGFATAEAELVNELTDVTVFDCAYIRNIHYRALNHLYSFAGEYRSVDMSKGGFDFATAFAVPTLMKDLENKILLHLPHIYASREQLVSDIAVVHAELLLIHPFREGNGRTMRILADMMSYKAGYDAINWQTAGRTKKKEEYIIGVQSALEKNYGPMIQLIDELLPLD